MVYFVADRHWDRLAKKQRWSTQDVLGLEDVLTPQKHILKSLAWASKPQVLESWPVLGSRTAPVFELLKVCKAPEKFFWKTVFSWDRLKIFSEDFFF